MIITILILVVLGLCILAGYYRGVVYSAVSIGLTYLSFFLALLLIPAIAAPVRQSKTLYGSLLYYFEGYEFVSKTSVELIHDPVTSIDGETLSAVIENAEMPLPLGSAVRRNIRTEAYKAAKITTLGDYFNQTIVDVVLNILSLLLLFTVLRGWRVPASSPPTMNPSTAAVSLPDGSRLLTAVPRWREAV